MTNTVLLTIAAFTLILLTIASLSQEIANSPYLIIALGIISTLIGLRAGRAITKVPTPHDSLDIALKGLPREATLYHYWLPTDHVLITPNGVFTLTPRPQDARLTFNGNKLTVGDPVPKKLGRFLIQQSLHDPVQEARLDAHRTATWLSGLLKGREITIQPILVFIHPQATFTINEQPDIPILYADKRKPSLKTYVREYNSPSATTLSREDIQRIHNALNIPDANDSH